MDLDGECSGLRDKAAERWLALGREERDSASLADEAEAAGVDESWPADQAALDDLVGQARSLAAGAASAATTADAALESARATSTAVEQVAKRWDRRESLCERRRELAEALLAIDADREVLRLADAAEGLRQVLGDEKHYREHLAGCAIQVSERLIAVRACCAAAPSLPDDLAIPPADDTALLGGLALIGTALARHRDKLEVFSGDAHERRPSGRVRRRRGAGNRRRRTPSSRRAERSRCRTRAQSPGRRGRLARRPVSRRPDRNASGRGGTGDRTRRSGRRTAISAPPHRCRRGGQRRSPSGRRWIAGAKHLTCASATSTGSPLCWPASSKRLRRAPSADQQIIRTPPSPPATRCGSRKSNPPRPSWKQLPRPKSGHGTAHRRIASKVAELTRARRRRCHRPRSGRQDWPTGMSAELQSARDLAGQVDDLQRTVAAHQDAAAAATEAAQRAALAASGAAGRAGAADSEAARLRARVEQAIGHIDPSAAVAGLEAVDACRRGTCGRRTGPGDGGDCARDTDRNPRRTVGIVTVRHASDQARSALREAAGRDGLRRRVGDHDTTTRDVERDLKARRTAGPSRRTPRYRRRGRHGRCGRAELPETPTPMGHAQPTPARPSAVGPLNTGAAAGRTPDALADAELWSTIADRCNGRTPPKVSLQRWVLSAYLEEICVFANLRLVSMTGGRYRLSVHRDREWHNAKAGLGLRVHDTHTGSQREVSTLSGGETFQASLSLALGVADVVTAHTGGVHLDALFVDEGFGTLDSEALQLAMDELDRLREGGRTVGLISHVGELRERIRTGIEVRPTDSGSAISVGAVTPQ